MSKVEQSPKYQDRQLREEVNRRSKNVELNSTVEILLNKNLSPSVRSLNNEVTKL